MKVENNKTCIITGSSRGIGKEIAKSLASSGHNVVITYNNNKAQADELLKEIKDAGNNAIVSFLNVLDRKSIDETLKYSLSEFKCIDVLVNNAGILVQNDFLKISENEWDEIFDINVKGVFNCCQILIPELIKKLNSKIINISSFAGKYGGPKAPHYSASKAAIICLTKSLARIYSNKKLLVNTVAPGVIGTDMFSSSSKAGVGISSDDNDETSNNISSDILLSRIGRPDEVGSLVAFLCSDNSNYITGATFDINGGLYLG